MSKKNLVIEERTVPFNYSLTVLSDLLSGFISTHLDIPECVLTRLIELQHDIEFIYNAEPVWLKDYDIENYNFQVVYSLKKFN